MQNWYLVKDVNTYIFVNYGDILSLSNKFF